MAENPTMIDEEQNKSSLPRFLTTPISERPTHYPVILKICPIGTRIENVRDSVYRILLEKFILFFCFFSKTIINVFQFMISF